MVWGEISQHLARVSRQPLAGPAGEDGGLLTGGELRTNPVVGRSNLQNTAWLSSCLLLLMLQVQ